MKLKIVASTYKKICSQNPIVGGQIADNKNFAKLCNFYTKRRNKLTSQGYEFIKEKIQR
jgi:hypothetical protein